jgi:hypothetical protein
MATLTANRIIAIVLGGVVFTTIAALWIVLPRSMGHSRDDD